MRNRIEFAPSPFVEGWKKLVTQETDSTSCDSVVGTIDAESGRKFVLKWNRGRVATPEETRGMAVFLRRSLDLYREALGPEYIVPTSMILGAKKDGVVRHKVFIIQPFIDSWHGQNLPWEIHYSDEVIVKWEELYKRLSMLYNIAYKVNRSYPPNSGSTFPVTLTVGETRRRALAGDWMPFLPPTPNILIERDTKSLLLCDFGKYTQWQDSMQGAYYQILDKVKKRKYSSVEN